MDTQINKYLKEIEKGLPCRGKQKKYILSSIREDIAEFRSVHADSSFNDLEEYLGTPEEIISSYISKNELSVSKQVRIAKVIKISIIAVATILILFICIAFYRSVNNRVTFVEYELETLESKQ